MRRNTHQFHVLTTTTSETGQEKSIRIMWKEKKVKCGVCLFIQISRNIKRDKSDCLHSLYYPIIPPDIDNKQLMALIYPDIEQLDHTQIHGEVTTTTYHLKRHITTTETNQSFSMY